MTGSGLGSGQRDDRVAHVPLSGSSRARCSKLDCGLRYASPQLLLGGLEQHLDSRDFAAVRQHREALTIVTDWSP
jgi:hypothetical protein